MQAIKTIGRATLLRLAGVSGNDRCSAHFVFWCAFGCLILGSPAQAYPPAHHHVLYGTVRNEFGMPFTTGQAQVILQTSTGVQLSASLNPNLGFGLNYELEVPMDSGLTADAYSRNAL